MNIAEKIIFLKQDFDAAYQKGIDKGRGAEKLVHKYRNLFVQDGLVYHMNFVSAIKNTRIKYTDYLVDKTDRVIGNPWWVESNPEFLLGDGYLNQKGLTDIFYYYTNVTGKKAVSLELAAAGVGGKTYFDPGPFFEFQCSDSGSFLYRIASSNMDEKNALGSEPIRINSNFNGKKINTYSFTYNFNNTSNLKEYTLSAFGNGRKYFDKTLESKFEGFQGNGTLAMIDEPSEGEMKIYSIRLYEKVLNEMEILQNHFADIATVNKLNISEFVKASEAEKKYVYKAFKSESVSNENLQAKLDKALADARIYTKYYELFVKNGLLYHMNFAEAVESTSALSSQAKYEPYVVARDARVANPWWDGFSSTPGNGYLNLKGGANILTGVKENLANGGDITITRAKKVSVELVAMGTAAGRTTFSPGLNMEFHFSANNAQFIRAGADMDPNSSFSNLTMGSPISGFNINTYSITYGFNDETDSKKYTLNMYGNGKNYRNQVITSDTEGFSGTGSFSLRAGALNVYAVRVYERELSADEVLQNHFADIALINQLDITEFLSLDEAKKQAVYAAFENVTANTDKDALQAKLDTPLN